MLHHLSLAVKDLTRAAAFYDAAVGYGEPGGGDKLALKLRAGVSVPGDGFHVAFAASSRAAVDAFYHAAMANGARDNGGTGLHPEYGPGYYAAFVIDPEGYRIEAVIVE